MVRLNYSEIIFKLSRKKSLNLILKLVNWHVKNKIFYRYYKHFFRRGNIPEVVKIFHRIFSFHQFIFSFIDSTTCCLHMADRKKSVWYVQCNFTDWAQNLVEKIRKMSSGKVPTGAKPKQVSAFYHLTLSWLLIFFKDFDIYLLARKK